MGFKLGQIAFIGKPVFLAPMEDVTDLVFRKMCRKFGAAMVYTEFVSADALVRKINRTLSKLAIEDEERPVALQLYGKDPFTMAEAAKIAEESAPDIIDINFGCPVRKIAIKGAGAGLLRNIPLMVEITRKVVETVRVPVTVKTRLGWDEQSKNITEIALRLQDCGISALTIHGRTREQMYRGKSDWTLIKAVKEMPEIRIPIIGNGDITNPLEAMKAFETYNVDAVMVGRAAIGAPWIFGELAGALDPGNAGISLNAMQKVHVLQQMLHENCAAFGEHRGILHTRRHLAATALFKGLDDFRALRIEMLRAESEAEIIRVLDRISEKYFG